MEQRPPVAAAARRTGEIVLGAVYGVLAAIAAGALVGLVAVIARHDSAWITAMVAWESGAVWPLVVVAGFIGAGIAVARTVNLTLGIVVALLPIGIPVMPVVAWILYGVFAVARLFVPK